MGKGGRCPFVKTEARAGRGGCAPHLLRTGRGGRGWIGGVGGWGRGGSEEADVDGGKWRRRRRRSSLR